MSAETQSPQEWPPTLIVLGAARSDGNTADALQRLVSTLPGNTAGIIDLAKSRIALFDYETSQTNDDFFDIVHKMLASRSIIFATPVYWYAMSGLLKILFDRLTDLLNNPDNRPLGRALANRDVWLLATGAGEDLPPGFEEPFRLTAKYFNMHYRGHLYLRYENDDSISENQMRLIENFRQSIFSMH